MYKKLIFLLLIVVLVLFCCIIQLKKDNSIQLSKFEGVDINIKEHTLSKTGATVVITDFSNNQNSYNEWYQIDIKINNKWKKLNSNSRWTNLENIYIGENNSIEFEINWKSVYGELKSGQYRLIKKINNDYIGIEFKI